jgi:hypothetical protein
MPRREKDKFGGGAGSKPCADAPVAEAAQLNDQQQIDRHECQNIAGMLNAI